jgi:hypothetical protein
VHTSCYSRRNLLRLPFEHSLDRKRGLIKRATRSGMPNGGFPMMKCRVVCLFIAVAALSCLGTGQNSQGRSSSPGKPGPDPLQSATKPLTPKSAMPAHSKSSVAVPNASAYGGSTNAELNHLELQNVTAGGAKSAARPPKGTSALKSADTSTSGSGINFKYHKPAGGTQASTPGANSANSNTPRVTKKN